MKERTSLMPHSQSGPSFLGAQQSHISCRWVVGPWGSKIQMIPTLWFWGYEVWWWMWWWSLRWRNWASREMKGRNYKYVSWRQKAQCLHFDFTNLWLIAGPSRPRKFSIIWKLTYGSLITCLSYVHKSKTNLPRCLAMTWRIITCFVLCSLKRYHNSKSALGLRRRSGNLSVP